MQDLKILYKYLNLNFQNSGYRHPTEEKKKGKRWVCKHTPIFSRVERRWYKARNDQSTLVLSCLILIFFKVWQYRKRRKNNVIIFLGLIPFTTECLDKLKKSVEWLFCSYLPSPALVSPCFYCRGCTVAYM